MNKSLLDKLLEELKYISESRKKRHKKHNNHKRRKGYYGTGAYGTYFYPGFPLGPTRGMSPVLPPTPHGGPAFDCPGPGVGGGDFGGGDMGCCEETTSKRKKKELDENHVINNMINKIINESQDFDREEIYNKLIDAALSWRIPTKYITMRDVDCVIDLSIDYGTDIDQTIEEYMDDYAHSI